MSQTGRPQRYRGWFKRGVIVVVAVPLIVAGLLTGGVRLLDHFAPQYRNALLERIGQRIDAHIAVDGLSLGWGWHGPILYLDEVRITHDGMDQPALSAARLGFEFSLTALTGGQRLPDGIIMDAPRARIVRRGDGYALAHWPRAAHQTPWLARIRGLRQALEQITIVGGRLTVDDPRLPGGHAVWHDVALHLTDADDRRLAARLSADGPRWLPHLGLETALDGPLDWQASARFTARIDGLEPIALASPATHGPRAVTGGTTRLVLDGRWQDQALVDTHLSVHADALTRRGVSTPLVPAFSGVFDITSDRRAEHLTARLARLTGGPEDSDALAARATLDTRAPAAHVEIDDLPGALALRLARRALPRLADTHVTGDISHVRLDWQPATPLAVTVGFHDLTLADPALHFGPVSGRYIQKGPTHTLIFAGAQGRVSAPHYLHGDLTLSDLRGRLHWQPGADHRTAITLDKLAVTSREAKLTVDGRIQLPRDGKPVVDLVADMSAPDVARLLDRLPQAEDLPNPRLREWLPQAITAGTLDHGHAVIRGDLADFPFPNARGGAGFHVTLAGHGLGVHYKDGWPPLENARGKLTLDGDTLGLDIADARMFGVDIDNARAQVADVREPVLKLTGHVDDAPADRLLAFLGQSPLKDKFGALVRALKVSGPADLAVDLDLPLKPELGDPNVSGTVTARGDTLHQADLPGPLTAIHGTLHFTGDGLSAQGLTARLLGVPITADLSPIAGQRQRIVAHATPELPADRTALAHYLPDAWLDYGQGPLPLTVAFSLGGHGDISPITVHSNLAGTAVNLPAPLAKPASATAPLSVTIDPDSHHIEASYNHDVDMALDLGTQGIPKRVVVNIGDRKATPPAGAQGLWISGHARRVDALGWFDVVRHVLYSAPTDTAAGPTTGKASKTGTTPPTAALAFLGGNLVVDRLDIGDRYIAGAKVRAQPMQQATGWRVDFEGDDSQGQVTWTAEDGAPMRIAGNLKRIAIQTNGPDRTPDTTAAPDNDDSSVLWPDLVPADLPALKLYVQDFEVDDTHFGELHVDAHTGDNDWHLDRFALTGGDLMGHISADWQRDQGLTSAGAEAHLAGRGLSRLLRTAGYVSPVKADQARVDAELSIAPNTAGLDLRHLNGQVHLALDDGALLTVEPGPGRLLGLFNLYVLPRRLQLNFRDVIDKGLAFDKIRADFDIRHGQAYSRNAHIGTPSSNIGISGRIGLATRDYDEQVRVQPKLGSGVAIASAVFGGPIVGAAVFAAQEILKKPIEHFSAISYRLKGSWDDPQILDPNAEGTDQAAADKAAADKTPSASSNGHADTR